MNLVSSALANELAPHRIRVNCIAPVMSPTGLLEQFMGMPDTPQNRAKFLSTIPLGRMSDPKDIAAAALYLASDEAAFVTGVRAAGGRRPDDLNFYAPPPLPLPQGEEETVICREDVCIHSSRKRQGRMRPTPDGARFRASGAGSAMKSD